jgi:cytoskeletal protein CcmA (bactofilin family)
VSLTIKGRQDAYKIITTQGLTQDELKQLANTDVTVGQPKQILTIQANAVFAGSTLIRGDLEVAGTLKLGGDLSLTNLTVTGATQLEDAKANNLTVGSNLNVQGTLQLNGGISVAGQSNFNGGLVASSVLTGALQLNGDLKLTHHITAGGTIPGIAKGTAVGGGGTVSLSGSDTAGSIAVNTGSGPPAGCFATVTFSEAFSNTPHVVITPVGAAAAGLNYYITRSTSNFVVCSTNSAPAGQTFGFDYVILG